MTTDATRPGQAKLTVLSGPSGVGKDSVIELIRARSPWIKLSVSVTTRKKRDYETDDVVGKLRVSAVLQAMPGIGKIRATQIMEKLKIADSRRLRGLGDQQRKALLGEFAASK